MEKKQFLTVPFEITKTGEEKADNGQKFFTFEGHASTFGNVDLGLDRVVKGAFLDSIKDIEGSGELVPALWQHDMKEPVGVYFMIAEDEIGLFVKGRMPLDDDFVRGRVVPQMKIGSVRKMSIGYIPVEWKYTDEAGSKIRNLVKVDLMEISLVTFPMNTQASITDMKSAIGSASKWADVEAILHDNGFSNSEAKAVIAKVKALRDAELEAGTHRDDGELSDDAKSQMDGFIKQLEKTINQKG